MLQPSRMERFLTSVFSIRALPRKWPATCETEVLVTNQKSPGVTHLRSRFRMRKLLRNRQNPGDIRSG